MIDNSHRYKLCIRCSTFNQSQYIEDALNGFVMQETDFPYVAAIVDDASTDGEPQLLREYFLSFFDYGNSAIAYQEDAEYGTILFAQHRTNKNCFFAIVLLKENHYRQNKSKLQYYSRWSESVEFIAHCEGDDYWTDPLKLQKQVDFLETHPDYVLCCHRFKIYHENTGLWNDDYVSEAFARNPEVEGLDVSNADNFMTRFTWTLTLCYRREVGESIKYPPYKTRVRDFQFNYHLLKAGKGYCFADYMGVYRMNEGGVWASLSELEMARFRLEGYKDLYLFHKDDLDVKDCYGQWLDRFYTRYALSPFKRHKLTKNGISSLFFAVGHYWRLQGAAIAAKRTLNCIKALLFG